MSRRSLLALSMLSGVLALATHPALADSAIALGDGQCPPKSAAGSERASVPAETAAEPAAATIKRGGGGDTEPKPARNKPRWQSYLPGMIR